jgi:hypothetical protein
LKDNDLKEVMVGVDGRRDGKWIWAGN